MKLFISGTYLEGQSIIENLACLNWMILIHYSVGFGMTLLFFPSAICWSRMPNLVCSLLLEYSTFWYIFHIFVKRFNCFEIFHDKGTYIVS